jgi:hypothetical protein
MNAATETVTVNLRQFADWLAEQLRAAGLADVRVWQGQTALRVYRGSDYVNVTVSEEHYGGPLSLIVGRDRGFARALLTACASIEEFGIASGTVTLVGVNIAPAAPAASVADSAVFGSRTRCGCCGRPSSRGPCSLRTDASGLRGYVREECRGDFSFA